MFTILGFRDLGWWHNYTIDGCQSLGK